MEYTGERYLPWEPNVQASYEHYHRYLLALPFAKGKRVLDLASGEGYGTALLAGVTSLVMIPFYEHWYSSFPQYGALTSDKLTIWLNSGLAISVIAFVGSIFGRRLSRIGLFIVSIAELYFWYVLSIAV